MKQKIESMTNPENWKPNFSKIAEETGKSVKTISNYYNKLKDKGMINIFIENLSEIEALEKKKNVIE